MVLCWGTAASGKPSLVAAAAGELQRWAAAWEYMIIRILYSLSFLLTMTLVSLAGDEDSALQVLKKYEASHPGVFRIAKDVSAPTLLHRVDPPPPQTLPAKTRISGVTIVVFVITAKGEVIDPVILRSQYPDSDRTLLDAIRKWKYRPATKKGTPVPVFFTITHNLILR